jgi:iron(III) transport system substrate-binding protein
MKVRVTGGNLTKAVFILVSLFMTVSMAFGADSTVKGVKQPSTQPMAKTDPGDWKKVIEAAKKEGKIVISGSPGEEWRKSLVDMFQREYPDITVEFSAGAGRNFWPLIQQERGFGKKLWDLRLGGIDALSIEAKSNGFLAPIRPLLLPEIADDRNWIGGLDWVFNDREKKYILGYILYPQQSAFVNRDFIKETDLKSSAQLVNPKFKGKIVILNPAGGSTAQSLSHMAFMYGENFVREFLSKQDVVVTDDNRQQVEWVVRGRYPISTNFAPTLLVPFIKQGLGKNIENLEDKTVRLSMGSGTLCLWEGAPHPNAARVYINWLLSQKTQIMLSKLVELNSSRTDVPVVDPDTAVDPAKISKSRNSSTEENVEYTNSLVQVIKEALKK